MKVPKNIIFSCYTHIMWTHATELANPESTNIIMKHAKNAWVGKGSSKCHTSESGVFGDWLSVFIDHPLSVAMVSSYQHHISTLLTRTLNITNRLV